MFVAWPCCVLGVGAALRVERRHDRGHGCAEAADHLLDDVVAADAQPVAEQLGRQVAVAEVPGDAQQIGRIGGRDLDKRLKRGADGDDAPVLQDQPVAVAQRHRLRQVEQELEPAGGGHRHAAAVALVIVEHHMVGRFAGPLAGGNDLGRADHRGAVWLLSGRHDNTGRPGERTLRRCTAFSSTRMAR